MAYTAEISRTNPSCFIFLLDQSGSMADAFGGSEDGLRKADFLADVVNRTLHDLVIRCTRTEKIHDYYHVALIGYGGQGVASAFSGQLAGRELIPISQIADFPARVDQRTKKVPDGAGGLVDQSIKFPVWIDPSAGGGTPMCAALATAGTVAQGWIEAHRNGFPPVILNISDGESSDGDPTRNGGAISELRSADGGALLFNCHLSSARSAKIEYPSSAESLPDPFARVLFQISSPIPPEFARVANQIGVNVSGTSRGFVFNADAAALVQFFDIGTRPANLR